MLHTAEDRIAYAQVAQLIEEGQCEMVPPAAAEAYIAQGLVQRRGTALELSEEGRELYRQTRQERQAGG